LGIYQKAEQSSKGNGCFKFSALPPGIDYMDFLAPGIIGMALLFDSIMSGLSVLWDRQFGFLKEIMVTPVNRVSIVLGKTAGGVTTAVIQGFFILLIALVIGLKVKGIFNAAFYFPSFYIIICIISVRASAALVKIFELYQSFNLWC